MNSCCEREAGCYSNEEDPDFRGDTLATSQKAGIEGIEGISV